MGMTERLAYILTADTGNATSGFQRVADAQAKVAVSADKLAVAEAKAAVAEAKAAGDADRLAAAQGRLAAAQTKLASSRAQANILGARGELAAAEKGLQGVTTKSTIASRAMQQLGISGGGGAMAAGAAATAAASAMAKFAESSINKFAELTASVRSFQRVSGASAEDASRLVAAFRLLGVDSDAAAKGVFKLGHEDDDARKKLEAMGVTIARTGSGAIDLTGTFLNVADAVHAAGAGARADEIAFAAFGRQGLALLPVLLRGRDGLQELFDAAKRHHEIFSDEDLEKGRQFGLATRELQSAFEGIKVEGGQALIPAAIGFTRLTEKVLELADKLKAIQIASEGWRLIGSLLDRVTGKHKDLAAAAQEAAEAEQKAAEETKKAATEADKQASSIQGLLTVQRQWRDADDKVTQAQKRLADAHAEVAQKARDEAEATNRARKADDDLRTAQEALSEAQRRAPRELDEARNAAALATDAIAEKTNDLTAATEKYGATSVEARKAADELTKAKLDQADAADKATALEKAGDRPPSVVQAEQQIAEAKQHQADAAEAKRKSDAEDPVADIAKAEADVRDAIQDRYVTQQNIRTEIAKANELLKTTVTVEDIITGKADEMLKKLLEANTAQQALLHPELTGDVNGGAGLGGFNNTGTVKGKSSPGAGLGGTVDTEGAIQTTTFDRRPDGTVVNIVVNAQTDADPHEIAQEIAWTTRARGAV